MSTKKDNHTMSDYLKDLEKHIHKERLRESRRKTGARDKTKKPRQKNWMPDSFDDWDDVYLETHESIYSPGERERRRMVEKMAFSNTVNGGEQKKHSTNNHDRSFEGAEGEEGLVIEGSGLYRVEIEEEQLLCSLRGSLKSQETGFTNVVAVGDRVIVKRSEGDRGVIESVMPRRSVLARVYMPDRDISSDLRQIIVANVDQVLIVASWREPYIWPELIDRYLITAQRNDLDAVICVNKVDLVEDQDTFNETLRPYRDLGFRIILTSAKVGTGITELNRLLEDRTTAFMGLSGVGKSSLLKAIDPELQLRTQGVIERGLYTGQGRHTTTQSSLIRLNGNTTVVDTPGIKEFGLSGLRQSDLSAWYPEMEDHTPRCKYSDCTHINEPECGVRAAVEAGEIAEIRYQNYCAIFECLPE
jgi:ribosome biogenesis GTPase